MPKTREGWLTAILLTHALLATPTTEGLSIL